MKRVMIIGQPGSGKSTLAAKLGAITGLPVFHIDREVHWKPGWVERDRAEKARLCAEIHAKDEWIFEGGNSKSYPERVARADMIIWLDFPTGLRMWRAVKRSFRTYGRSRPDMADNCPERFDFIFFKWIWDTRKSGRRSAERVFASQKPHKRYVHLQTAKNVGNWLAEQERDDTTAKFGS